MALPAETSEVARDPLRAIAPVLLALLGLGFGASVFAEGYYDIAIWGPIGLGMLALLLALVVAIPVRLRGPAATALAGLVLLWLWSSISSAWAESDEQAHIASARWAMYAATFGVLVLLLRGGSHRRLVLGFTAAGVLAVALYVVLAMLLGEGETLFFGGRLRDPLGYPNGQAGYFLAGLWPFVALAEWTRKPLLAGLGAAGAFLIACILLVGQTRGVLPAVALSGAAILLLVPGRGRRLWILILVGAGLALVSQPLLDVYRETPVGRPRDLPTGVAEDAAAAMLIGAVTVGLLWAVLQYLASGPLRRVVERSPGADALMPRLATAAAIAIVCVAILGAAVALDDPAGKVKRQYDEFVNLKVGDSTTDSRFFSGGGYRYDYWRVAWGQFKDNPLKGLGAGGYDRTYFLERRTNEDIRQPHSLGLQTLAELGLVGGLALSTFVFSVLAGIWHHSRRGRDDESDRLVAVAAGGVFLAWLTHTSVDWLHVIPGVTAIALVAAAVLVAGWVVPDRRGMGAPLRLGLTLGVAIATLAAAQTVARPTGSHFLRTEGQDDLKRGDPVGAVRRANQASSLEARSIRALYLKSAAYARLDRYPEARAALLQAARLEPHEHLPWALLGDLAARRGDDRVAARNYKRALRLNPQDAGLRGLAADPRLALRAARE